MRVFRHVLIVMLSLMAVMTGAADTAYWQQMATGLYGRHVYQDPSVQVLSDQQIAAFDALIVQSAKPIYVVVVNQAQAGKDTNAYPSLIHEAFGQSGAYAVVGPKTFKAAAFDVPNAEVARGVTEAASRAFAAAKERQSKSGAEKGADAQLVKDWVDMVSQMDWTVHNGPVSPPQTGTTAPSDTSSSGMSGWLIAIVAFLGLGGVAAGIYYFMTRRKQDELEPAVASYEPRTYGAPPVDIQEERYRTTTYRQPPSYSTTPERYEELRQTSKPGKKRSKKRDHYFGGGYTNNGQYYAPGYYPASDPFWNYLIWTELLDHDQHDYDEGYRAGQRDADRDGASSASASTSDSSSTDTGSSGYSSGYSGGGDFGSSDSGTSSSPSWSAPSFDDGGSSSPSSFSSFDSGPSSGGFDSGNSGGGDF